MKSFSDVHNELIEFLQAFCDYAGGRWKKIQYFGEGHNYPHNLIHPHFYGVDGTLVHNPKYLQAKKNTDLVRKELHERFFSCKNDSKKMLRWWHDVGFYEELIEMTFTNLSSIETGLAPWEVFRKFKIIKIKPCDYQKGNTSPEYIMRRLVTWSKMHYGMLELWKFQHISVHDKRFFTLRHFFTE